MTGNWNQGKTIATHPVELLPEVLAEAALTGDSET